MELPIETPRSLCTGGQGRASAGFSLVELMVTILIASILVGVAVPSFRGAIANNRLTGQTNEMVSAMTLARSQAITQNQSVSFCRADTEADTACSATAADWNFWLVRTAAGTVVRRGATQGFFLAVSTTLTNNEVVFGSDGLARTNGALMLNDDVADITVCSDHAATNNIREIRLGTGSRISTVTASGACP
jgi:type IV fimbrial biogenesis protein FimT